jgi:hypothetical protein
VGSPGKAEPCPQRIDLQGGLLWARARVKPTQLQNCKRRETSCLDSLVEGVIDETFLDLAWALVIGLDKTKR